MKFIEITKEQLIQECELKTSISAMGIKFGVSATTIARKIKYFDITCQNKTNSININKEQLKHDYESGMSMSKISKKYFISTGSVFRQMKKFGIQTRQPTVFNIVKDNLELDYKSGLSISEISKKYGVSRTVVFRKMKKFGIQSRSTSQMGRLVSPDVRKKISDAHKGKVFTIEHRRKISESKKGEKHPNFGKKCKHSKRCWYTCPDGKTVSMRSQWEVWYAEHLKLNNIDFKYEPKTFILSNGRAYTPDFLIVENNEWIEVKGWFRLEHMEKLDAFQKEYPNEKLILADKKYLQNLGIDLRKKWIANKPQFPCECCNCLFPRSYPSQRFCSINCRNKNNAVNKGKEKTSQLPKRHYSRNQAGSNNNVTNLTDQDVRDIHKMRESGAKLKDIANVKKVSISNLGNILKGRSWQSIYKEVHF